MGLLLLVPPLAALLAGLAAATPGPAALSRAATRLSGVLRRAG